MLFTKLKLNYFGRFQSKEIELKPGMNLICGDNEAGKSTIHTFIKGMLFGIERMRGRGSASKEDIYTRYLPWDYPGAFGGSLDLKVEDKEYRLLRSFHANDKYFTITDLSSGRELKRKDGLISDLIPGLTESTFKNTISIEQLKAQTDSDLAAQVRNYIANLSISKSNEVNVAKAVSQLNDQRKQLEGAQNLAVMKNLQTEIEDGILKEERIDQLTIQLKELLENEEQLRRQKESLESSVNHEEAKRMEQFPAILEKYRSLLELTKQSEQLELKNKDILNKISFWEKEQQSVEGLKEDIIQAEQLRITKLDQERAAVELQKEKVTSKSSVKINYQIRVAIVAFASLIMAVLSMLHPIGLVAAFILFGLGMMSNIIMLRKGKQGQVELENKINSINKLIDEAQAKIDYILKKYQVASIENLIVKQEEVLKNYYALEHAKLQQKEWGQHLKELEDKKDVLYEAIMKYMQCFLHEDELTNLSMQKLKEEIEHRKQATSGRISEIHKQYENCKLRIERLRWEIASMEGNEEQLIKNRERYLELEKKQKEIAVELEAIKLALSTIQELSTDIHDSFGQQLNEAVSEVICEVTGQKYDDLKIDEKLDVKVGWNGSYVLLDRLSAGTIDQVYFALRLAIADLLLGENNMPLLLDDSFALYDETRVKAALSKISQRSQILLFTCHKREETILKELAIPYHLVDLSCP